MDELSSNITAWPFELGSGSEVAARPSGGDRAEVLAERLAGEMADAWDRGARPLAEAYLERYPELAAHPEAAARLIYEEICQREAEGEDSISTEVIGRFPQWKEELEILLDCHRLVQGRPAGPRFPEAGETLGDCRLLAVLGRGTRGRVFLASQSTLADRPVVLKVTRRSGGEHLSMARLQHPNIMPLYAVHDRPEEGLRVLCMPYLGGATLAQVFERLSDLPPGRRTGVDLVSVLDLVRTDLVALPAWSTARQFLAGATFPKAICWIGACLAEALHYAHARGLLHLDLKPSNVLLADDGQPMLLDFHLARGPLRPEAAMPEPLGGTRGYMSPEQEAAMAAIRAGRKIPSPVDGRSDVYSLGVMLHEALVGAPPNGPLSTASSLHRSHPHVTTEVAEILERSLAHDPEARYPDAAALAEDLRRYLEHLPLQHIPDRSRMGRWSRWWRRLSQSKP